VKTLTSLAARMKSCSDFVANGGWHERQSVGRRRARFFGFLSVMWLLVSTPSGILLWDRWSQSFGYLEWLCLAMLVPQPVFVLLAFAFLLTEKPLQMAEQTSNPDYDLRKLY
jgi:hypothetical protein